MDKVLLLIKKIIPKSLLKMISPGYHKTLSYMARFFYGNPSNKMIVVGVTGTNGKSTTVHLTAKILEARGGKTGEASTVFFKIGDRIWLNDKKMTMLGRFSLQKLLKKMVKSGCRYAVIETSSEGIRQFRHLGINYDVAVFTNLTPEHIESHGGFENYKKAKLELFRHLAESKRKIIKGEKIKKIIIANLDDRHSKDFLNFKVDKKIGFTLFDRSGDIKLDEVVKGDDKEVSGEGSSFNVRGNKIKLKLLGEFNIYNALAGIAVGQGLGFEINEIKKELEKIREMEGRMELIEEGQKFTVVVDYAPEPESLYQAYKAILNLKKEAGKIIHILGSCGGGRDIARRPILGEIAGEKADYVIVTNEDPYDDDPEQIINDVAKGAIKKGKEENKNLFKILDRREAIRRALTLAADNDLILITGKGSEQAMCVAGGEKIPWDDRRVVKEELGKMIRK